MNRRLATRLAGLAALSGPIERTAAATPSVRNGVKAAGATPLPIVLALPRVEDSASGETVPVEGWGEIQLCWDRDNLRHSLYIPYATERALPAGETVTAI